MVMTYSEFMASKPVSHFSCGQENRPHAFGKFFKTVQADSSPERMERLKEMLRKSKTGRQTLEFLEQKGSDMIFEAMDYYGYFSPDENKVALNPAMSDEDLAVTFVHEVRHAWQDSQMETTTPTMTPKSFLVSGFLIEADACAAEVTYAHEMRETNPEIWEAHQQSCYAPMSTAFAEEFEKSGDIAKAREAALKTWYDLGVKNHYADSYTNYLAAVSTRAIMMHDELFYENRPTDVIVDTLCHDYDGKQFFKDAPVLETPEKLNLNTSQATRLNNSLRYYMRYNNKTAEDLGLDKITVIKKSGKTTTCAEMLNKPQQSKSSQTKNNAAAVALANRSLMR